jgi:hypothetical protein
MKNQKQCNFHSKILRVCIQSFSHLKQENNIRHLEHFFRKLSRTTVIEITTRSEPPQAKAMGALPPNTVSVENLRRICGKCRSLQAIISQRKFYTGTGFKKKPGQSGKQRRGSGSGMISAAHQIQRITDNNSYLPLPCAGLQPAQQVERSSSGGQPPTGRQSQTCEQEEGLKESSHQPQSR